MRAFFDRVENYGKLHWKELLALVLAAVPAFFLLFHKGTQQAASNAISYIPAAFGGDSGGFGGPGGDPGSQLSPTSTPTPSNPISAAVAAVTSVIAPKPALSVNGANAVKSPSIPDTGFVAAPGVPTARIAAKYPVQAPPPPGAIFTNRGSVVPLSKLAAAVGIAPRPSFNPVAGRSSGNQAIS